MSLFDQQPFGPIPARRPIRVPPDPELEAAGIDPDVTPIELVDPPAELVEPVTTRHRHPVRNLIAWLLLIPLLAQVVVGAFLLAQPNETGSRMTVPYLISGALVLAVILVAYLLFTRSQRGPARR